jgi:SAM-dependent methyltransferase
MGGVEASGISADPVASALMDSHYTHAFARAYDGQYAKDRDPSGDRTFYLELARRTGGPVMEVGCGTGRVLIPIAKEGFECVGLDASESMLEVARSKDLPANLRLLHGDARSFDLAPQRFALILSAFRAFQHLYTVDDQLAFLARARDHLAPGGLLAFDVFDPNLEYIAKGGLAEELDIEWTERDLSMKRYTKVTYNHRTQVLHSVFRVEAWRESKKVSEETNDIHLRWFYRYELEHLLARAGYDVVERYGDFEGTPIGEGNELVFVARH